MGVPLPERARPMRPRRSRHDNNDPPSSPATPSIDRRVFNLAAWFTAMPRRPACAPAGSRRRSKHEEFARRERRLAFPL